jgi:hypothetical protein
LRVASAPVYNIQFDGEKTVENNTLMFSTESKTRKTVISVWTTARSCNADLSSRNLTWYSSILLSTMENKFFLVLFPDNDVMVRIRPFRLREEKLAKSLVLRVVPNEVATFRCLLSDENDDSLVRFDRFEWLGFVHERISIIHRVY